jgi:histidinol-phosphate aminotransferase
VDNANIAYNWLVNKGIIVRNRSSVTLCGDCLRITVGTPAETAELIAALKDFGSVFK